MKILITGASGNVGKHIVHYLLETTSVNEIIAAARDTHSARRQFTGYEELLFRQFDFENSDFYADAFADIDILFLLRPPHLSNIDKVFRPMLLAAKKAGIKRVVFLSVQGVEKSSVIPHHKIENLIIELGFEYIFVRPGYFMQNLTTTLLADLRDKHEFFLPAGKAKFNWIDTRNIAEFTATLIRTFDKFASNSYEVTGSENMDFYEVAQLINSTLGTDIEYRSVNPIWFYFSKRAGKMSSGLIMAMLLIHFSARFQSEPLISDNYMTLTGKQPTSLREFLLREKDTLIKPENREY